MLQPINQPTSTLHSPDTEEASLPRSVELFNSTILSAQALVVENLVTLLGSEGPSSTLPIESYLELINKLKIIPGEKPRIDFKENCLVLGVAQQDGTPIDTAKFIIHTLLSLHAAQQSSSPLKSDELQTLHRQNRSSAHALIQKLTGKDGTPFGLAKDIAQEQLLELISEVLESDEADLEARRKIRAEFTSLPKLPESAVKVDPEFSFLGILMNSQRERLSDKVFVKNLWQAYGIRLNKIIEIPNRVERAECIKAGLRSICNLVAKEYLIGRKHLQRNTLRAQASEAQSKLLADLIVESLQGYLFACGGEARSIPIQSQLHKAANQMSTTVDLTPLLHSSDSFLIQLRVGLGNLDLSQAAKSQWLGQGNGRLTGTSLTQATLLIAATPKGADIIIPTHKGQLLIGHKATNDPGTSQNTDLGQLSETSKKLLLRPNPYFVPENGYPSRFEALSALHKQIDAIKDVETFSRSLPPVWRAAFDRAIAGQQRDDSNEPGLDQWILNVHALYEGSASDSNKRSKTVIGAWEIKTKSLPELSTSSIQDLNDTFAASQGKSAQTITKSELTTAYFLTSLLAAYIRGADDSKESARLIDEAIEKIHQKSGEMVYLLVRIQLALLLENHGTESVSATPRTVERKEETPPVTKGRFSFFSRKDESTPIETPEARKIHLGESFQDLRTRVAQEGAALIDKLESLKFLEQQAELRIVVAGKDDLPAFQQTLRNTSNKTHPDTRAQDFPQPELHSSLDLIYRAMMDIKGLVSEDAEYDGQLAKRALTQLVKGVADLSKKEVEIENQVQRKILAQLEVLTDEVIGLRSDLAILLRERADPKQKDQSK